MDIGEFLTNAGAETVGGLTSLVIAAVAVRAWTALRGGRQPSAPPALSSPPAPAPAAPPVAATATAALPATAEKPEEETSFVDTVLDLVWGVAVGAVGLILLGVGGWVIWTGAGLVVGGTRRVVNFLRSVFGGGDRKS